MPLSRGAKIGLGVGAVGALAALVYHKRKEVKKVGIVAFDYAKQQAFSLAISDAAKPYAADIIAVADELQVSPFLLYAFGDQESRWGVGSGYKPKGAIDGSGDFGLRLASTSRVKAAGKKGMIVTEVPDGWVAPKDSKGPWIIPVDGKGYGRGIFQLDALTGPGMDVDLSDIRAQARAAIQLLRAKQKAINALLQKQGKPLLSGDDLVKASIAAYNTGEGNVVKSIVAGKDVDSTTTGGAYSSEVLSIASKAGALFNAKTGTV